MTEARRLVKILLLKRSMSYEDLAKLAGVSASTLHLALSGRSGVGKAKQAITNACARLAFEAGSKEKIEFWPGVRPTLRFFTFPAGAEMQAPDYADDTWAQAALLEFEGFVERVDKKTIRFVRPTPVVSDLGTGKAATTETTKTISGATSGQAKASKQKKKRASKSAVAIGR